MIDFERAIARILASSMLLWEPIDEGTSAIRSAGRVAKPTRRARRRRAQDSKILVC